MSAQNEWNSLFKPPNLFSACDRPGAQGTWPHGQVTSWLDRVSGSFSHWRWRVCSSLSRHTPGWALLSSLFQLFPFHRRFPLLSFPRQRCHSNAVSWPPCLPPTRATPASLPPERFHPPQELSLKAAFWARTWKVDGLCCWGVSGHHKWSHWAGIQFYVANWHNFPCKVSAGSCSWAVQPKLKGVSVCRQGCGMADTILWYSSVFESVFLQAKSISKVTNLWFWFVESFYVEKPTLFQYSSGRSNRKQPLSLSWKFSLCIWLDLSLMLSSITLPRLKPQLQTHFLFPGQSFPQKNCTNRIKKWLRL